MATRFDPRHLALLLFTLTWTGCGEPAAHWARRERTPAPTFAPLPPAPAGIEVGQDLIPADNPLTPAKVHLGKQLYFDPRLSRDGTVSCASCHHPDKGFGDAAPVSTGIDGQKGGRSAPTVMNRVLAPVQFWDGRAASLEEQALGPIGNPIEMGFSPEEAAARLATIPGYATQFQAVFGGPVTPGRIAKAIASYERTVMAGGAPHDYHDAAAPYLDSEPDPDEEPEDRVYREKVLREWREHPMSAAALRGKQVYFQKGKCSLCHVGPNLADEQYHNLGVGMAAADPDLGRYVVTKKEADKGAFKTPTLRNIADTAPYMHDGSQKTLEEVVEFYDQGGHANPWLSPRIQKLGLTAAEKADLVAFLREGLQGVVTGKGEPELPPAPAG